MHNNRVPFTLVKYWLAMKPSDIQREMWSGFLGQGTGVYKYFYKH